LLFQKNNSLKAFRFILIFIFCFVVLSLHVVGQKKMPNLPSFDERPLHFGFLLGLNTMDFRVFNSGISNDFNDNDPIYAEVVQLQPGINIGIVSNLRLRKHWDLRFLPGISFGQRDLYFISRSGQEDKEPLQIKSTFIEFPLHLKYSAVRQNNFKPYMVIGVNERLDLAKSKKDKIVLRPLDTYLEVGAGIDWYLEYFRFTTELKASFGMADVLNHKGTGEAADVKFNQAIDKLTSNIFHLTFYFE
jgi:hypothetical protein